MTIKPGNNPFVPHIPIPKTGEMYTEHHAHVDVDALFDQYDESDQLKTVVQQAIRSLEQCIRGYDADMQGSERQHKVQAASLEAAREESRLARLRVQELAEAQEVTYHDLVAMTTQCNDYREKVEELSHESKQLHEQLELEDLIAQDEAIGLIPRLNKALDRLEFTRDPDEAKYQRKHVEFLRSL